MEPPECVRHTLRVLEEVAKIEQERLAAGETAFLSQEALREMAEDRLRSNGLGTAQTGTADSGRAVYELY